MARVWRAGDGVTVQAKRRSTGEPLGDVTTLCQGALSVAHERLAPGRRASPRHTHTRLEEAVYVLEGRPTLWLGDEATELGPGDFVSLPPGGPPHAIENRSAVPVTLLTMRAEVPGDETHFFD